MLAGCQPKFANLLMLLCADLLRILANIIFYKQKLYFLQSQEVSREKNVFLLVLWQTSSLNKMFSSEIIIFLTNLVPLTIHVSIVNLRSEFHATNVRRTVDSTDRLSWQQEQQRDFRYFRYLDLSIMHCDSSAALSNVCSEF